MKLLQRLHCLHRFWRYRLSSEKDSIAFLRSQNLRHTTVLDLGANKGAYSYWLAKAVGPKGKVLALEPQPELIPLLTEIKDTFQLANLQIINKAASNHQGMLPMHRKYEGHGGAMITHQGQLKVPSVRLDDLIGHGSQVSYIKCDVEGHELEALQGAHALIQRNLPIIQVEVHHKAAMGGKLFSFLENLGYKGSFIHRKQRIPISHLDSYSYPRSDNHRNYFFVTSRQRLMP